mgnify:CR=1
MQRTTRAISAFASAAALGCLLIGTGTKASPMVTIDFDRPIFGDISGGRPERAVTGQGYDNVHIAFGHNTAHVAAGRFTGTASNVQGVDARIFVDGVERVFMYCYDLLQAISGGKQVEYAIDFSQLVDRTRAFIDAVNRTLNTVDKGKQGYDPYAWVRPGTTAQSAAIQLGLWESKYETPDDSLWDLGDGRFQVTNGLNDATSKAFDDFHKKIVKDQLIDTDQTMMFRNDTYQDMITADPPGTVPAPATLGLFAAGLAALLRARRRRG